MGGVIADPELIQEADMGLDVYAGTMTRYYSHNWKTIIQQWGKAFREVRNGDRFRLLSIRRQFDSNRG